MTDPNAHSWRISPELGADTYCRRCGIGPDGIPGMSTLPPCVAERPSPTTDTDRVVLPGEEGYEDAFDVCPERSCPLYDRAVMADHRHLRHNAPQESS